jgi:hygromycin-B 7''-O-kinase
MCERGPSQDFGSLGTIPLERLQLAADLHGLGRVLGTEFLGGTYGNNVGVATENGDWVLRGAIAPIECETLRRERFFARIVHERSSIEAPWPYWIDGSSTIFGWPYALMRRLPGKVLHPALDLNWAVIGRAPGQTAAQLQGIHFPRAGEWRADLDDIGSREVSATEWFERRVEELKQRIAPTSWALDATSTALVDGLVADAVPAIGEFEPTYVHGDLGIGNLTGERTSHGFKFTGVFDLGGGFVGDPDEDLATPIWWRLYWGNKATSRALLDSYRIQSPPRPGQAARLPAYVVVSMLANWELGRRRGFAWYGESQRFCDWALPLLDQVDAIIG